MRKLLCLIALLASGAVAQIAPTQPFVAGQPVASAFGQWASGGSAVGNAGKTGSVTLDVPWVTILSGYNLEPFFVGNTVTINDGTKTENVVITSSSCKIFSPTPCVIGAHFANTHNDRVSITSATFGLNEAISVAEQLGGTVLITPDWRGKTSDITAATGQTNVLIHDMRNGSDNWYGWNGSAYVETLAVTQSGIGARNIEQVRYADQFPGADWCARVNAASADLAGAGIIYEPKDASACSQDIALSSGQTLILQGGGSYNLATHSIKPSTRGGITSDGHAYAQLTASVGAPTAPEYLVDVIGALDVTVRGIWFYGSTTSAGSGGTDLTDTGIFADQGSSVDVRQSIFEKLNIGINLQGAGDSWVADNVFRNIIGSTTTSNGYGVLDSGYVGTTPLLGSNNHILNNRLDGRNYPADTTSVMRHGIYVSASASNVVVSGNIVDHTLLEGITTNSFVDEVNPQTNNVFTSNILESCDTAGSGSTSAMGFYGWWSGYVVSNNQILTSGSIGIALEGVSGDATHLSGSAVVSGNWIGSSYYHGIHLGGVNNVTVTHNTIYNPSVGSATNFDGVALTSFVLGGVPVAGSPVGDFVDGNHIYGGSYNHGVDDQADHSTVNTAAGNIVDSNAAGGAIQNASGHLVEYGNYTGASSETDNLARTFGATQTFNGTTTFGAQATFNAAPLFTAATQWNWNAGLPPATNGSSLWIAAGFSSPVVGKIYVGDGTGYELDFAKRTGSADTTLFQFKDSGEFDAAGSVNLNGGGSIANGQTLNNNGTILGGDVNPQRLEQVRYADRFATPQAALTETGSGNILRFPSVLTIGSPLSLGSTTGGYSNATLRGSGIFAGGLYLQNGANSPLLDASGADESRFNLQDMFFSGNKANQSGSSPCVVFGSATTNIDTSYDRVIGAWQCAGDGFQLANASRQFILGMFSNESGGDGLDNQGRSSDNVLLGGELNFNGGYGLHLQNDGSINDGYNVLSVGNHFESNTQGGFSVGPFIGFHSIGDYSYGNPDFLGQQSRETLISGLTQFQNLNDAGFYNDVRDSSCGSNTFYGTNGACALRNLFPLLEKHYDPSLLTDWDMGLSSDSAWTAGTGATVSIAPYTSPITGQQYLRVSCSSAPCEAYQTVNDTTGGNAWLRLLWATPADGEPIVGVQVRRGDNGVVLVDSGWLGAKTSSGHSFPEDRQWASAVSLPAGVTSWTVALRCNSTTSPCLFDDVRLVENYLTNPGFESGTTGWTTGGTGSCVQSSANAHTGVYSAYCSGGQPEIYQTPDLSDGDYYMVRAWVYATSGEPQLTYGGPNNGGRTDGYTGPQSIAQDTILNQWVELSFIVRGGHQGNVIGVGSFGNWSGYVDDVSVVRLSPFVLHSGERFVNAGTITGGTVAPAILQPSSSQTTITGTTSGTAVCTEPFQGSSYKKALCYLNGYENTTATAQTYTFPAAFSNTPYLAHDDAAGSTVSGATLTLPASMGAPKTGWIVVEGF